MYEKHSCLLVMSYSLLMKNMAKPERNFYCQQTFYKVMSVKSGHTDTMQNQDGGLAQRHSILCVVLCLLYDTPHIAVFYVGQLLFQFKWLINANPSVHSLTLLSWGHRGLEPTEDRIYTGQFITGLTQ